MAVPSAAEDLALLLVELLRRQHAGVLELSELLELLDLVVRDRAGGFRLLLDVLVVERGLLVLGLVLLHLLACVVGRSADCGGAGEWSAASSERHRVPPRRPL